MTKYQLLPPLSPEEYAALKEDISSAGVRVPIDVDENGDVLDGHHRKQICDELGIECPERVVRDLPDFAKVDYALTVNLARRHLDRDGRRKLVERSLKRDPRLSDREHARRCGVSHPTVSGVRAALELSGQVESFTTSRTGGDGKVYAAKPTSSPITKPDEAHAGVDSAETGDAPTDRDSSVATAGRSEPDFTSASEEPPCSDAEQPTSRGVSVGSSGPGGDSALTPPGPSEVVNTPIGPISRSVADALDKHVPDPDPHGEYRAQFIKAIAKVHALMRFKAEDIAERGDDQCFDELVFARDHLHEYLQAVQRARLAARPDNVTPIRRPA